MPKRALLVLTALMILLFPFFANAQTTAPRATGQATRKASSRKDLLEAAPWLTDTAFQREIESLALEMGLLVKAYQDAFRDDWKRVHYEEGRTIPGKVLLGNIAFNFATTKAGQNWRLELSPDPEDPNSHPFAPGAANALEILGRDWRLIHQIHGQDENENVVASGTY